MGCLSSCLPVVYLSARLSAPLVSLTALELSTATPPEAAGSASSFSFCSEASDWPFARAIADYCPTSLPAGLFPPLGLRIGWVSFLGAVRPPSRRVYHKRKATGTQAGRSSLCRRKEELEEQDARKGGGETAWVHQRGQRAVIFLCIGNLKLVVCMTELHAAATGAVIFRPIKSAAQT